VNQVTAAPVGPILEVAGVCKSFPGVVALDGVDFAVHTGEVNALVGENGAGKSTLIKLLAGFYAADDGEIRVGGRPLAADPAAAHQAGVATIHQDHQLIPSMTVAENIMLGHWPGRFGIVSRRAQDRRAAAALAQVAPDVSPLALARRLSPAEGQLVEIARALSEDARVVIMDEPTTSLSPREIDRLFAVVRQLQARSIGIVFVSHWLDEVFRIADRITVLRDGRLVGSRLAGELDQDRVIRMMVGRAVQKVVTAGRKPGDVVLAVRNLSRAGVLHDISFEVRAGEIVALAGLVGAGRSELANCIFGVDRYEAGSVLVDGRSVRQGDPVSAMRAGIGLIPEDRRRQALIPQLSVSANATLAVLERVAPGGVISRARETDIVETARRSLSIRMPSASAPVSTLSGGNQQKVVIARWLARAPRLLILDEPTKGVDVGAKAEISDIIVRLARSGTAILLISSELPEVLALADRALVMRGGRIRGEVPRHAMSSEAIMNLAATG
jgi:ABC-type sugar transport system ATPase subunit